MKTTVTLATTENNAHKLRRHMQDKGWKNHWWPTGQELRCLEFCDTPAGRAARAAASDEVQSLFESAVAWTLDQVAKELASDFEFLAARLKRANKEVWLGGTAAQETMRPELRITETGKTLVRTGVVEDTIFSVVDGMRPDRKRTYGFYDRSEVELLEVSPENFNQVVGANPKHGSGHRAAMDRAKVLGFNAVLCHNPTKTKYGTTWSPCRILPPKR